MKFIYGPVNSRRLGLSLGISIIPHKTCNFDCLYCQLGKTVSRTKEPKEYIKISEVIEELKGFLSRNKDQLANIKYITLSGSGEPTLNEKIGELIREIKKISSLPAAVITNSALLIDKNVRNALLNADLIIPSLDTSIQNMFERINRPVEGLKIEDIIESLIRLRKDYKGKIWLEVMLIRDINDSLEDIKKLKQTIDRISPDRIQINSPVRTTAEPNILPVPKDRLKKIREILGEKCEII